MSIPVVRNGVSSADDAVFAYAAKGVASGKGYGFPRSHNRYVLFDNALSTGPTLILPIALLIRLFGNVDQLPGAGALVIFYGQLMMAAIFLSRRFGWPSSAAFLSATLWLLMIASANQWFFGSLLGEPVTCGFILLGIACLAVARHDREIAISGVCFALAVLTKQIALFAVIGIVGIWVVVSIYERVRLRGWLRQLGILFGVGTLLTLAFEATKVAFLGWAGYREVSTAFYNAALQQAVGGRQHTLRLTTFRNIFFNAYLSAPLWIALVGGSLLLLILSRRGGVERHRSCRRFTAFAWAGAAVYLAYILFLSILWPRYFWIGIAALVIAICAPLLGVERRLRLSALLILFIGTIAFGFQVPLYGLRQWMTTQAASTDRAIVVRVLDINADIPYAAESWHSLLDVLYLRNNEGTWRYAKSLISLQNRDFLAVINNTFTDKQGAFATSVLATCEPITPGARQIAIYKCGKQFWSRY